MLLGMIVLLLALLRHTRLGPFLHERIADRRAAPLVASMSFFSPSPSCAEWCFASATDSAFHYMIMADATFTTWFGNSDSAGGRLWMVCEFGTGSDSSSILASIFMSILYGVGRPDSRRIRTLVNLKDVYLCAKPPSIDAVILFGSLLAVGGWARRCFRSRRHTKANH